GNRNFEARIHGSIRANYLMSPPLVVAFALAGRVDLDLTKDPIAHDSSGQPVYLKDLWPSDEEVEACVRTGLNPQMFISKYAQVHTGSSDWESIPMSASARFPWRADSTYIQKPPFFENFSLEKRSLPKFEGMRPLAIFGDSITTDHISPAGSIAADTPAGNYLMEQGVPKTDFNSYGSRRGNDRVMTRGTFANVRIKNRMLGGREGGFTFLQPERQVMPIYDAAQEYRKRKEPLIIIAGRDYGMGSSRDWAAKGTTLLGVQAVVAVSFERIHRSNLVGMGVLPLEFQNGLQPDSLHLTGDEIFNLEGISEKFTPRQSSMLIIHRQGGKVESFPVTVRLDTQTEIDYYLHGGIMPYVLRNLVHKA
ncbi:MAG TPA: aconitase family protein, partial [Opitutales bacterium]|nr:aconitase family protein [Opitutales bacterium]